MGGDGGWSAACAVGPSQGDRREVPTEADRDLQGRANLASPADVRRAVEVARGVGVVEVQGRRDEAVTHGKAGDGQLGRARRAEQVADLRLVRRAGHGVGMRAERFADRPAFEWVVLPGGGAVDVDVIEVARLHLAVLQRQTEDVRKARGVGVEVGDMVGVGPERAAGELGT